MVPRSDSVTKFDYLIEWKFSIKDQLIPTSSLVKGAHFVFSNPLLYRKYMEETFLAKQIPQDMVQINPSSGEKK